MNLKEKFLNAKWYYRVLIFALVMLFVSIIFGLDLFEKISRDEILIRSSLMFIIYSVLGYFVIQKKILVSGWLGRGIYYAIFFFTMNNAARPKELITIKFLLISLTICFVIGLLMSFLLKKFNKNDIA